MRELFEKQYLHKPVYLLSMRSTGGGPDPGYIKALKYRDMVADCIGWGLNLDKDGGGLIPTIARVLPDSREDAHEDGRG